MFGNVFKEIYEKVGFDLIVLGRILEDGGIVINYLVFWGIVGSFVVSIFGIFIFIYLLFVFFSLFLFVFLMVSVFIGWGILKKFVKL